MLTTVFAFAFHQVTRYNYNYFCLYLALILPLLEHSEIVDVGRVGDPEQGLVVGDEEDVFVPGEDAVHPVLKDLDESLVAVEPEWVEGE